MLAHGEVVVEQRRVGHERQRRARARSASGSRCGSKPQTRTLPPLGSSSPAIARTAVDLPLPLAPISATHSPAATVEAQARERDQPPVAAAQATDHQRGIGHRR